MGSQLDLFAAPAPSEPLPDYTQHPGPLRGVRRRGLPRKQREATEDSESARVVREEMRAPPPCPHHGPGFVCEREGLDTDHSGFVHRSLCNGRIALRWCAGCGQPTTPGRWNHADWSRCIDCSPLGAVTGRQLLMEQSRDLTNNRQ